MASPSDAIQLRDFFPEHYLSSITEVRQGHLRKTIQAVIKEMRLDNTCWSCEQVQERRQSKRCGNCLIVTYHSRACQSADWQTHKLECDFLRETFANFKKIGKFNRGLQSRCKALEAKVVSEEPTLRSEAKRLDALYEKPVEIGKLAREALMKNGLSKIPLKEKIKVSLVNTIILYKNELDIIAMGIEEVHSDSIYLKNLFKPFLSEDQMKTIDNWSVIHIEYKELMERELRSCISLQEELEQAEKVLKKQQKQHGMDNFIERFGDREEIYFEEKRHFLSKLIENLNKILLIHTSSLSQCAGNANLTKSIENSFKDMKLIKKNMEKILKEWSR